MSRTIHVTLDRLPEAIEEENRRIVAAIHEAVSLVAHEDAVEIIAKRVPVAFGELKRSIDGEGSGAEVFTTVSAPHAAAVEVGSMPHAPNYDRLLEWVRLRITQGFTKANKVGPKHWHRESVFRKRYPRSWGPTTPRQASAVAREATKLASSRGGAPIDQAEEIAKRIFRAIEHGGTQPNWYVRDSIPAIGRALGRRLKEYLKNS